MSEQTENGRREVASRNTLWANSFAKWLSLSNITPNQISVMSVVFSAIGGGMLFYSSIVNDSTFYYIAFIVFIICIQLRLLCNLFDGMVAVEGGKKTPNGDLYNDIPDRFSDIFLIIPTGYIAQGAGVELAWLGGVLAVMTAYFRWIGAYKTQRHYFDGPMAKQHRMALLIFMSVVGLFTVHVGYFRYVFLTGLIILNIGLVITLIRRLKFISKNRPEKDKK